MPEIRLTALSRALYAKAAEWRVARPGVSDLWDEDQDDRKVVSRRTRPSRVTVCRPLTNAKSFGRLVGPRRVMGSSLLVVTECVDGTPLRYRATGRADDHVCMDVCHCNSLVRGTAIDSVEGESCQASGDRSIRRGRPVQLCLQARGLRTCPRH